MARGPYRTPDEPSADDDDAPDETVEFDEEVGPVVVGVHDTVVVMPSMLPRSLRWAVACVGIGLCVLLGMIAFAGRP